MVKNNSRYWIFLIITTVLAIVVLYILDEFPGGKITWVPGKFITAVITGIVSTIAFYFASKPPKARSTRF